MAFPYAGQVEAVTNNHIIPKLTDQVYNNHAILKRFRDKAKFKSGGVQIQVPLTTAVPDASDVEYFDGFDSHDITPSDRINAANFVWKQIVGKVHVSRKQVLQNGSPEGVLQLVAAKTKYTEDAIRKFLTLGFFSDGTAATGALTTLQLTGTAATLSTSSTYGGIAVADLSTWAAQVDANSGTNRQLTLDLMTKLMVQSSDGMDKTTLIVSDEDVFREYHAIAQPHERLAPSEAGRLGFETADGIYRNVPIIVDKNTPGNEMHFYNEEHLYLCIHRQENMRVVQEQSLEKQNSLLIKIYSMLNLVCDSRRRQGLLDDITAG